MIWLRINVSSPGGKPTPNAGKDSRVSIVVYAERIVVIYLSSVVGTSAASVGVGLRLLREKGTDEPQAARGDGETEYRTRTKDGLLSRFSSAQPSRGKWEAEVHSAPLHLCPQREKGKTFRVSP